MKKGGNSGASEYGHYVWSANQHPVSGNGNLIQAVGDPAKFTGGKKRRGGKGILTAVAVPAVLIAANHFYKRRSKSYKKGGANPSTQDMLSQSMKSINQIQTQLLPKEPSGTIFTNSAETKTYGGGSGIVEAMAVPAVLLTANHLYSRRKRTQKRGKRSRRYSMKTR